MEKFLLLKGCAGLGNRLLTLICAAEYAKSTKRTLIIDWNDGLYFPNDFNFFNEYFKLNGIDYLAPHKNQLKELFEKEPGSFYPVNFKNEPEKDLYEDFVHTIHPLALKAHAKLPKVGVFEKLGGIWIDNKSGNRKVKKDLFSYLTYCMSKNSFPVGGNFVKKKNQDVVVFADYTPVVSNESILNLFELQRDISEKISSIANNLNLNECVGIHVRSTDLKPTKAISTLIEKIKKDFPNEPIFLATDNPSVQQSFNENFKDVRVLAKNLPEESELGSHQTHLKDQKYLNAKEIFENGLIDMILLSKVKNLIFQGNSTFSIFSSQLRNGENSLNWLKFENT